ncbi:MAG: hypothetical protein ACYTGQ_14615 [Planctomycetota bacterium]|jgi:hypothetical protein
MKKELPLPVWGFVLLGIPTFLMPTLFVVSMVLVFLVMMSGEARELPKAVGEAALGLTVAMWVVYLPWVVCSRRLTRKEKCFWAFVVFYLNMFGMPWYYVFMVRRYLGLEGRTNARDRAELERFLNRHEIDEGGLSSGQLDVLRAYSRENRLMRWCLWSGVLLAAVMIVGAFTHLLPLGYELAEDWAPTRLVVIDSVRDTREVTEPDPEYVRTHVQLVMMFGAFGGMFLALGLMGLCETILRFTGTRDRRVLVRVLKASGEAGC